MIGFWLSLAYRLPSNMDEWVFTRIIVQQAGFDVSEADLTREATEVIRAFCHHLDDETPSAYQGARRSGSQIIERCVELAVPHDKAVAYQAFAGLHPELRGQGLLKRYRPTARAALARDLRRVGRPIIDQFARAGRFTETDHYIDSAGVRCAGPAPRAS